MLSIAALLPNPLQKAGCLLHVLKLDITQDSARTGTTVILTLKARTATQTPDLVASSPSPVESAVGCASCEVLFRLCIGHNNSRLGQRCRGSCTSFNRSFLTAHSQSMRASSIEDVFPKLRWGAGSKATSPNKGGMRDSLVKC